MSPLSISLPAPEIEWEYEFYGPAARQNPSSLDLVNTSAWGDTMMRPPATDRVVLDSNTTGGSSKGFGGYAGSGGTGVVQRWEVRHNRSCLRTSATTVNVGNGTCIPFWGPFLGDPVDIAPGAFVNASATVLVFDMHLSIQLAGATTAWPADTSPFFFLPLASTLVIGDVLGAIGADKGGWGVFVNNVAGVPRYEYVSWSSGNPGAALERVTVPLSSVADITDWNTFRFVIVSGDSTRRATLSVQANGIDLVVGRDFGGLLLQTPLAAAAPSTAAEFVAILAAFGDPGGGGDQIFSAYSAKVGRFTPDGAEQRGQ